MAYHDQINAAEVAVNKAIGDLEFTPANMPAANVLLAMLHQLRCLQAGVTTADALSVDVADLDAQEEGGQTRVH